MAEEHKDIDHLFREKLGDHSVQPSPMAWEKLESRLARNKKGMALWMRIAASLLLLGGLTALLWLSVQNTQKQLDTVADQELPREIVPLETPNRPEIPAVEYQEQKVTPPVKKAAVKKPTPSVVNPKLAAVPPAESEPAVPERIPVKELAVIELPPMDTDLLVADNTVSVQEEQVPNKVSYKITIISNGLRATPEKETLVGEIENKIEKIGGVIGKVDQGFADLQDAKNNLFASITTKNNN